MPIDLQSVDVIRERVGATYDEALDALKETDGDVLEALARLEIKRKERDDVFVSAMELFADVEEMARDWEVTGVKVRYGGRLLADIPVHLVSIGAIAAALLAAFVTRSTIELDKKRRQTLKIVEDENIAELESE
ncbi:MAG: hypothetical protein PHT33_15270 [bacterium]|nr:hypothetical protein [bacterium]